MRHAANTHAVDLNTGRVVCGYPHVDVVHADSRYVTCWRCCRRLRAIGIGDNQRRALPKVYLVTGLRVVRAKEAAR